MINRKNEQIVFGLILFLLFIILPFIRVGHLIPFVQSGQSLFFLVSMGGLLLFVALFKKNSLRRGNVKLLDGLLFAIIFYIILNGYFLKEAGSVSFRLYDLTGLCFLYLLLRQRVAKKIFLVLVFIVVGALVQAVYGELQLYGFYPTLNRNFPITGSFFNPGPYSGYLAVIFPSSMGLYFFIEKHTEYKDYPIIRFVKTISLITALGILLVLSASQSRAAWLAVIVSSVFLCFYKFHWNRKLTYLLENKYRSIGTLIFTVVVIGIGVFGMYSLKKDSADGRVLIWKTSWEMIRKEPLFGQGFDRFKAEYMMAQANYFIKNPSDPAVSLADNVVYLSMKVYNYWSSRGWLV